MLTFVAWIVFICATFWNVIYWVVAFGAIIDGTRTNWNREIPGMLMSLVLWFVPGIFLFGLF